MSFATTRTFGIRMEDPGGYVALLRFLVNAGLMTEEAARLAEAQIPNLQAGRSLIDWLKQRGTIQEEQLAAALAKGLHFPLVDLPAVALDPAVTALVPEELAMRHQVVPLRISGENLVLTMANPLDNGAIRAVEFATSKRVQVEVATQTGVRDALEHAYHFEEALQAYVKGLPEEADLPVTDQDQRVTDIRGLLRDTNLAPVVKLCNSILKEGLRARASDIHIETAAAGLRVRYRIDGVLEETLRLPKWVQDPLIARCKVLAKLDITERHIPQDGRIQIRHGQQTVDLHVSSLPTQFGEKLTMRVLDASNTPTGLDALELAPRDLKSIRRAIARTEGLILVTGPTGSGKTTTLYAMIAEISSPKRNIITIENRIEYRIDGLNQVEISEKHGLTFASALHSVLRQDPDVILVGEIRDAETAEIAVHASQTGHLVLSTLPTTDTVSTIGRLINLGIGPHLIASSLHLVIAQRLVRKVCAQCAEPYMPDAEALQTLQIAPAQGQFRRGRGCSACRKSGYSGRIGVFEVLRVTVPLAKLIENKAPESALRAQAGVDGMVLLSAQVTIRVSQGVTTAEEALRVVDVAAQAGRCPSCDRPVDEAFAVCPACGAALRSTCTTCRMPLHPEWQVCPYCAAPVKPTTAATPIPERRPQALVSPAPKAPAYQYRALVVDDQPDLRRLITFALERSGLPISARTAANGPDALEQAQHDPPDVILLDVMMPGMDGFEVCQRLRANVRTAFIPILMVTARDDAASRGQGFLVGTDDYITKPFAPHELLARVRRLLERTYGAVLPIPRAAGLEGTPRPDPSTPPRLLQ